MNSHLVIGASGQVGEHLLNALHAHDLPALGTYFRHEVPVMTALDVRDAQAVRELIERVQPPTIYLPASLTHVDWCEENVEESFAINVQGAVNVARAAQEIGAKLVYFSSDYVFDGENGPYDESDVAHPISEYGRQKVLAEHYLALHQPNALIIRTTVVYGWERQGKNFVQRLREVLGRGERMRVPVDQIGSPSYAPDVARASVELAQMNARGVFHVAGPKLADRYEFACTAARVFGLDENLLDAVTTAELGQVAPRPLRAGMRVEKAVATLQRPLLGFEEGLQIMAETKPEG